MALSIEPNPSIFDEVLKVSVEGLHPFQNVTIYTYVPMNERCHYESFAHYRASENGYVDLFKDQCFGGTYSGVEPMGLFWSLKAFAENMDRVVRFLKRGCPEPVVFYIDVYNGTVSDIECLRNWSMKKMKKTLVSATATRMYIAPGVKRVVVRENGLVGTMFIPKGKGPFPGVINLFGGYPGVLETKSALHAANGIASLTLAYYGVEGLTPRVDDCQDIAYFEKGVKFLKNHPDVDGRNGIGIVSICKGSNLALAMAVCLDDIRCVVWTNNAVNAFCGEIVYKDWHCRDRAKMDDTSGGEHLEIIESWARLMTDRDAIQNEIKMGEESKSLIPFHQRHHVSYLFIASLDDHCCPSFLTIQMAEHMLKESGHPDYELVRYEGAGHLLEPPFSPHPVSYFQPGEPFNMRFICGGKTDLHCKAQEDSWKRILHFLKAKLTPKPESKL